MIQLWQEVLEAWEVEKNVNNVPTEKMTLVNCFQLFETDMLSQEIVHQTNLYALSIVKKNKKPLCSAICNLESKLLQATQDRTKNLKIRLYWLTKVVYLLCICSERIKLSRYQNL